MRKSHLLEVCPRCGSATDAKLRTELRHVRQQLRNLQRSVASHVARAAGLMNKARKGGSNE
jgi:uncharacterized membrane-anchored protein YhcB (DUF1043 family)